MINPVIRHQLGRDRVRMIELEAAAYRRNAGEERARITWASRLGLRARLRNRASVSPGPLSHAGDVARSTR